MHASRELRPSLTRSIRRSQVAGEIRHGDPEDAYAAFHAPRYAFLLQLLERYIADPRVPVLDIGPSKLTGLIARTFRVRVDSLGFDDDGPRDTGRHYRFDLNDAQDPQRWRRDVPRYDVIILAEVIEHLYTSPILVLAFIKTLLQPTGVLIVQTPNAVALHKRLKMALGRHPYELIRTDRRNPGHFREYAAAELRAYAEGSGLVVEQFFRRSYFDWRYVKTDHEGRGRPVWYLAIANLVYALSPPALRPGLTVVLRLPRTARRLI